MFLFLLTAFLPGDITTGIPGFYKTCCCACCLETGITWSASTTSCRKCSSSTINTAKKCAANITLLESSYDVQNYTTFQEVDLYDDVGIDYTTAESVDTNVTKGPAGNESASDDIVLPGSIEEQNIVRFTSLPEAARREIGFQLKDMILDCQYAGYDCDYR